MASGWVRLWIAACIVCMPVHAQDRQAEASYLVAIIIDDLGYNPELSRRALALPGPVSYGVLPALPDSRELARQAHALKRDVLIHIPMQPVGHQAMGPGALTADMGATEMETIVVQDLQSVPYAIGISNHMGSRFTADRTAMQRFFAILEKHKPLFFLDSRTTAATQTAALADLTKLHVISRDVFLDNELDTEHLRHQFNHLLRLAKLRGKAIAVAHAHARTLAFLEQQLQSLKQGPVRLVPVSLLLNQNIRRN